MQFSDNGVRFDATLRGTITLTDDLTDVQSLSDGGSLTIRDWSHVVPRTVEIRSAGGKLTRSYYVGGLSRPWDDDARLFLATQLPLLVRRSGLGADARVKSIFEKKGVDGVLEEIDRLGSDYARRLYFTALLDAAHLDSNGVKPILARVSQRMTTDYDRREVLEQVAARVTLDRSGSASYLTAMASMKSDYDQRQALSALVKRHGAAVDGDAMVAAVGHMKSTYDKRMVLADVIGRGALSLDSKKSVLQAAAGMDSDYDRAEVLLAFVKAQGIDPVTREAFMSAAERFKSSYDQDRVLAALAKSDRR